MSSGEVLSAACLSLILLRRRRKRRERAIRKCWVREWILGREHCGVVNNLLQELYMGDQVFYKNFLRMSATDFEYLLRRVTPLIQKEDTLMRKSISPTERLVLTLRYLATGDSYQSLMYLFRVPTCTISRVIPEVCDAIYSVMKEDYIKVPNTEDNWVEIAKDFHEKWNFPNCIGTLDGKHVNIRAPANRGSLYFNYKGAHSIILMALADANYKLIYINVGSKGRDSDGGVFDRNCSLSKALESNTLNIPSAKPLPGRTIPVPHVIVADDAFALKPHTMKPFAFRNQSVQERIFNYRLSRTRRVIENVFGIISARFRCLRRTMEVEPNKVKTIVCAVCVLHNFSITRSAAIYAPRGTFDRENGDGTVTEGTWRSEEYELVPLQRSAAKNAHASAKNIREEFKEYFCREGEVPWQYRYI